MNTFFVIALVSTVILTYVRATANDTQCLEDLKAFEKCFRSDLEKNEGEDTKKLFKVQSRISKCFTDNKCEEPNLGGEPFVNSTGQMKDLAAIAKKDWEKTPEKVKQCFKKSFGKLLLIKANKCLKSKKVDEIKVDEQHLVAAFKEISSENKTDHMAKLGKAAANVLESLMKCRIDQGSHAPNATMQCMSTIKSDVKEEVCKRVQSCKKDKVSDTCRKRGKEVETAICQCQLEILETVDKAIEKIQDGKTHPVQVIEEIVKGLQSEFDDVRNSLGACFNETDPSKPVDLDPIVFALILQGHHVLGPSSLLPLLFADVQDPNSRDTLRPDQINFMHNFVEDLIQNHECGGCNKE